MTTSNEFEIGQKQTLYLIKFIARSNKFYRACICFSHINPHLIKKYIAISVNTLADFVEILSTEEVYVLNSQIEEAKNSVSGYIDAYWLDVITYLVSIEQDEMVENFTIVAGMYTNEKDIENIVRTYYTNSKILVHDIKDGWLMRPEKLKR